MAIIVVTLLLFKILDAAGEAGCNWHRRNHNTIKYRTSVTNDISEETILHWMPIAVLQLQKKEQWEITIQRTILWKFPNMTACLLYYVFPAVCNASQFAVLVLVLHHIQLILLTSRWLPFTVDNACAAFASDKLPPLRILACPCRLVVIIQTDNLTGGETAVFALSTVDRHSHPLQ